VGRRAATASVEAGSGAGGRSRVANVRKGSGKGGIGGAMVKTTANAAGMGVAFKAARGDDGRVRHACTCSHTTVCLYRARASLRGAQCTPMELVKRAGERDEVIASICTPCVAV
jgi:hypothetical protein